MDPIKKMWMFQHWSEDQHESIELAKNHAYLLGSFSNPEAVSKLIGNDGNTYKSTDEELEDSMKMVVKDRDNTKDKPVKRRRRKKIKE